MRLDRMLITAGLVLVAAVAAIAIGVPWLAPRLLAPAIAESVEAATGRELVFGEVHATLWPRPALVLSRLRFGNAAWGSQPWLAQVGRATAAVDALALLSGRLRIRQLTLDDASVLVETDADGSGNWVMGSSAAAKSGWPEWLEIDELTLRSHAITYRDGKTGEATSVQFDSARIAAVSPSRSVALGARASFEGRSVEAAGTIGPLAALIANTPLPVDLEAKVGAARLSVRGSVDRPHDLAGFELALNAQAPETAELAALVGASVAPLGPLRGTAQLTGSMAAPVFAAIDVAVGVPGRIEFTARGAVSGKRTATGVYAWTSSGVDLLVEGAQVGELARSLGKSVPALGPYRIAARVAGSLDAPALSAIDAVVGGDDLPRITLRGSVADLRGASGIDLRLAASATDWWQLDTAAGGPRLPPFRAGARVRGARQQVRIDDLELKVADSTVNASLQVAAAGPRPRVTGRLTSPLIDLARRRPAGSAAKAPASASAARRPSDLWRLADVDLDLQITRLVLADGRELRSGSGRIALDDGRLNATAVQAKLGGGTIRLDGSVAELPKLAGIDVGVAVQGGELAGLLGFFGKAAPALGRYQGQARLQGSLDALRLTAIDASAGRAGQRLRARGQIDDTLHWQGLALEIAAEVADSTAAGRLFGADLPRLPALRGTARVSGPQGGYVFDDLDLTLGRTAVKGRVVFAPGEPRPRVTASLGGPLVDLSELPPGRTKPGGTSPTLAADVDAEVHFDRLVLPDRRALGPVTGVARLTAGAIELRQFSVAVDGARASVEGTIGEPLKPAAIDLAVNAEVRSGAGLAAFTGAKLQGLPAFTASARLTDLPDGYALAGLELVHAATTVAGDLTLRRGASRFRIDAKLASPSLDASAWLQPDAVGSRQDPVASGARAIAAMPLPLDALRLIDADLDLRIDAVKLGDAPPLGPLQVRAVLADGRLEAAPIELAGPQGQLLSVRANIDAPQATWDLRVEGKRIGVGTMLARFGHADVVTGGSADLALQLRGRGRTVPALLASLDGDARVEVGPLRVHNFAIRPDRGIFMRAFGMANPFAQSDPDTEFNCIAARMPIRSGVLSSDRGVAAETAKYNLVLGGTLNLRTEAIDLALTPIVKSGLGVGAASIASIVRIGGTLGAPTLGVDAVGVAKSAVGAGVAVLATPWWLADTLLKRAAADPSPCATALAR